MDSEFNFLNDLTAEEIQTLSPLVLAYIGDAYFHLYVRTRLLKISHKVSRLHELGAKIVSATYQAQAYEEIEKNLSDEEKNFFRRGRNAKSHAPRSSSVAEYHASTGFETLLGELFLKKNFLRLEEICAMSFDFIFEKISEEENL